MVPDVRITEGKLIKTGSIASEASKQMKDNIGLFNDPSTWLGWKIILNPFWCVASKEENLEIVVKALYLTEY